MTPRTHAPGMRTWIKSVLCSRAERLTLHSFLCGPCLAVDRGLRYHRNFCQDCGPDISYSLVRRVQSPKCRYNRPRQQFEPAVMREFFGCMRLLTTAYLRAANAMAERIHSQLNQFGMPVTAKVEIGCSATKLVFGNRVRLPAEFGISPFNWQRNRPNGNQDGFHNAFAQQPRLRKSMDASTGNWGPIHVYSFAAVRSDILWSPSTMFPWRFGKGEIMATINCL